MGLLEVIKTGLDHKTGPLALCEKDGGAGVKEEGKIGREPSHEKLEHACLPGRRQI